MSRLTFNPLLTPRQVIEHGAFGGNYFGVDVGAKRKDYKELFEYHFKGLDTSLYLGEKYKPRLNAFKTRAGMPYEYWVEQGWMHQRDPYGWFEWWCKYDMGLRGEDDNRQISRWQNFAGIKGRWRHNIYKKIYESNDDWNISPRISQSLLHWGYATNEPDYEDWIDLYGSRYKKNEWCNYGGLPSPNSYL